MESYSSPRKTAFRSERTKRLRRPWRPLGGKEGLRPRGIHYSHVNAQADNEAADNTYITDVIQKPSKSTEHEIAGTPRRIQACESLLSAIVQVTRQCDIQTWALFPERSEAEDVALTRRIRFFTEFLSFFISAVDRAADFKGLTQEQRKEIHERIVPAITEATIDIFAPRCSADLRGKLRSEICFNINYIEREYNALDSIAIYQKLATNIQKAVDAMHHPAIARQIVLIAREQLLDADFARLVVAFIEAL